MSEVRAEAPSCSHSRWAKLEGENAIVLGLTVVRSDFAFCSTPIKGEVSSFHPSGSYELALNDKSLIARIANRISLSPLFWHYLI